MKQALLRVFLAFSMVLLFTFTAHEFRSTSSSAADFPMRSISESDQLVEIPISQGSSGSTIAQLLFTSGVIQSSQSFFKLAVIDDRASRIAPGIHLLNKEISAKQALLQLLDPKRIPNLVRVFEGAWNSEIYDLLEKSGFKRKEILKASEQVRLPSKYSSLEGLLFPAQYSFPEGSTAVNALQAMVDNFEVKTSEIALTNDSKLSAQQLIIVASIIQAEGDTKDFAKISRVIRNRLSIGMPLQMDSTIHYVKKVRGSVFLSTQSTLLKSPYNTYRKYGLPPGPIGNPGLDALRAAVNPADGEWLYFITVSPGDTRFTSTISEFNTWKVLYTKNRKAGAFK
ncbi:MAG: endolytic transglycosylase MltG [Candidatus Nanopelagicaceae bacterium]